MSGRMALNKPLAPGLGGEEGLCQPGGSFCRRQRGEPGGRTPPEVSPGEGWHRVWLEGKRLEAAWVRKAV